MTQEQLMIFLLLGVMLALFSWGKVRYDIVSLGTLCAAALLGIVPTEGLFRGFGHNAVVTVVAVLVISAGLQNSGFVDFLVSKITQYGKTIRSQMFILTFAVAVFSAFMNNVGALSLFLPATLRISRLHKYPASRLLMPLAFSSLLGGMMTLVGSPPNIIISSFRKQTMGAGYRMFDFFPIGAPLTIVGVLFIVLIGYKLIPVRKPSTTKDELFEVNDYTTMVEIQSGSELEGKSLKDLGSKYFKEVQVIAYVRDSVKYAYVSPFLVLQEKDRLILQGGTKQVQDFLRLSKLPLSGSVPLGTTDFSGEGVVVQEVVVTETSNFVRRTAKDMELRSNFNVNLLGVAREGARLTDSPNRIEIQSGDVLLLQGTPGSIQEIVRDIGALPLMERGIEMKPTSTVALSIGLFFAAILLVTFEILPADLSFTLAAVLMVITGVLSLRKAYEAIELPILILLGSLIPVSEALETTGAAELIASKILSLAGVLPNWTLVMIVIAMTMLLTNIINNAAAALLMAPIAISMAMTLGLNVDAFLMAVFVGATSAFMTPIGHQSNTLIMGPGGFQFRDYWKLGFPLSLLVIAVTVSMIMIIWPI
jgi:di/tricarboxylate transporter